MPNVQKKNVPLVCIAIFLFCLCSFGMLIADYLLRNTTAEEENSSVLALTTVTATINGVSQEVTLPYTFTGLAANTEVVLSAGFVLPEDYSFYIESESTPVRVYVNGSLVYAYGLDGTYPDALQDPAAAATIVPLDDYVATDEIVTLYVVYNAPTTQDYFVASPIFFGSQSALYEQAFSEMGFSFIFSTALLLVSVFLAVITCVVGTFERRAFRIFPLAFAGALAGLWLFCDCTLTTLFIAEPTLLYPISVYAMALFPIPLIWFALSTLTLRHRQFLFALASTALVLITTSVYMLRLGIVPFQPIEKALSVLTPLCVSLLALYVLFEYIRYHVAALQRFAMPAMIFAFFTILELLNQRFAFIDAPLSFFQIGSLIFIASMGILAGFFVRDSFALQVHNQQESFETQMMDYQADMLKKHSALLMESADDLRKQRHDLRHQLTAIRAFVDKKDLAGLEEYLDAVIQNVPSQHIFYCKNATINAILSHYTTICKKEGIALTIDVNAPERSHIPDTDFCVVFGNLLENAVEAAAYLPPEERSINITATLRYSTLLIKMENSFDGHYTRAGIVFRSRKRDANGIGLASIHSIARKHGGDAQFKPKGNKFTSSVYLTL